MAQLGTQQIVAGGVAPVLSAASGGGDTLNCGDHTMLRVNNGGGGSVTVTIAATVNCNFGVNHPLVITVAAGTEQDIGPVLSSRYGNVNGVASVTYSAVTSLTVAAISV